MVIAVIFTWKRCGWCTMPFTNSDGICGYCSELCKARHEEGAIAAVRRNADGVFKCTLQ